MPTKKDWYNVSLKGVQGFKGMSHEHKSLTTTILKKRLENKMHEEKLRHQLLLFWKSTFL